MGRPKRNFLATAEDTTTPPTALADGHTIAQVNKAEGKNLYLVRLPFPGKLLLVELPPRFRSQIWIKRGTYVVVDTLAFKDRDNKLHGEIFNVVRNEKQWRKQAYWPAEFVEESDFPDASDQEESTVGKLPPVEDSGTSP